MHQGMHHGMGGAGGEAGDGGGGAYVETSVGPRTRSRSPVRRQEAVVPPGAAVPAAAAPAGAAAPAAVPAGGPPTPPMMPPIIEGIAWAPGEPHPVHIAMPPLLGPRAPQGLLPQTPIEAPINVRLQLSELQQQITRLARNMLTQQQTINQHDQTIVSMQQTITNMQQSVTDMQQTITDMQRQQISTRTITDMQQAIEDIEHHQSSIQEFCLEVCYSARNLGWDVNWFSWRRFFRWWVRGR